MELHQDTYKFLASLQSTAEVVQELLGARSLDARPEDVLMVADAIDRCALQSTGSWPKVLLMCGFVCVGVSTCRDVHNHQS